LTYEFLKDFHRRAEIVAIVDFLTTRISRKQKLRDYDFDNAQAVNLVMLVLCFIMEKSLLEESCTKNDIAIYLRRLDASYLNKKLEDEEYLSLADYLIKDCLQNNGIPHYFASYNFERAEEEKINVKLIDDKRVQVGTDMVYSYYMTPQGYKFMFNTLEIEDAMQVSIEQFKLSLSIKKRNFNSARTSVDNLFNISKTQIQKINYFIKKIREDIGNSGIEEYEKIYNSTFSSLDEQKKGYDNLYELIGSALNSIRDSSQGQIDKEALKLEVDNISYIKNRLKLIISEQSKLLLKQQELQKIYNEAVDDILYIGSENRISIEDSIVKKLEENPERCYPMMKILRPLFLPDLNKLFNLQKVLKEQKIQSTVNINESSNILMSDKYFSKQESDNDIRIRLANERYLDIFECICKYTAAASGGQLRLSEMIRNAVEDYEKLVPDLKTLTNVLLQLSNLREIDFMAINKQRDKTVFNPSEEFDVKYCVLELMNRGSAYKNITYLKILLSRTETVFISESAVNDEEEAGMQIGLNCPDILFRIGVKDRE